MNLTDRDYLRLLEQILNIGVDKSDRTGTGTRSMFGATLRFDMREGFPLLTTKRMHTKSIVHELLWFLKGSTNIKYLVDNGVSIWNEWPFQKYVKKNGINVKPNTPEWDLKLKEFVENIKSSDEFAKQWGELGPVYGRQWRSYSNFDSLTSESGAQGVDQIWRLVEDLKHNPDSRRLMVNAWNPSEIQDMALPPCHYAFQCWTRILSAEERFEAAWDMYEAKKIEVKPGSDWTHDNLDEYGVPARALSLMWQQRSCDVALGIPFNIASYGLLLEMLAQCVNMIPEELIFNGGDCHIYNNHFEGVQEQLKRKPYPLCKLKLNANIKNIDDFKYEDIQFIDYISHPAIKMPIAV